MGPNVIKGLAWSHILYHLTEEKKQNIQAKEVKGRGQRGRKQGHRHKSSLYNA